MIARIVAIVVFLYVLLVSAGVGIVWLLSPKIGFIGGLAVAAAGFALLAWGIIRIVAARLKGVMAMVRSMQGMQGMAGGMRPGGPTIDAEVIHRGPDRPA